MEMVNTILRFYVSDHGDYLFMHVRALCLLGESSTDVTAAATADGNGEYGYACPTTAISVHAWFSW
jgi:hypothetical protein